jgi:UDP-glucuronate decarboxylase
MHPDDGRVVSNFIVQALRGAPLTIYGDGSQTRAFCFVDDLIEGFLRLMAAADDVTGPINLGNPHETSVAELAELVIALTGSRSTITSRPLPIDDPVQRCPDIGQAKALLRWQPTTSLKEGLSRTIAYFDRLLSRRGTIDDGNIKRKATDPS